MVDEKTRKYNKKYYIRNKIKNQEYYKIYYDKNKGEYLERDMKRMYKMSRSKYELLYKKQFGKCKICKINKMSSYNDKSTSSFTALVIDHCHTSGKVRGLLCNKCNVSLGLCFENIIILENMIKYLKSRGGKKEK